MKIELHNFFLMLPNSQPKTIKIPVYWDEEIKDWILTEAAHSHIDLTKLKYCTPQQREIYFSRTTNKL